MPAAVVKGIILSISIITALSFAVLENPQVQIWLEEQRRKIADMLRSFGEEFDPETRRVAEAFAYEGKTPATDDGLRREVSGSKEATAIATGSSLSGRSDTIRRIPVKGPSDPDEAEERKRKGREYLARRNQQMYDLQQRRKTAKAEGAATPPSPTSFDAMVDNEGKLKQPHVSEEEMPAPPSAEPVPKETREKVREAEQQLVKPLLAAEASNSGVSGYQMGSRFADPFGDEYALERSLTPKPPVPPKIALEQEKPSGESQTRTLGAQRMPGSYSPLPTEPQQALPQANDDREALSYDEQLAIALSLSEAESSTNAATVRQRQHDDDHELRAAIAASLKEMDGQQAAHAIEHAEPLTPHPVIQQTQRHLLDIDDVPPSPPRTVLQPQSTPWDNARFTLAHEPSGSAQAHAESAPSETTEDLYSVTPQLTRARLASFEAQQSPSDLAGTQMLPQPAIEASFYSAPSSVSPTPGSRTTDNEPPQLINFAEAQAQSPTSRSPTLGFRSVSNSEIFASLAGSRTLSQAPSHTTSDVEVIDLDEDSDVDMLSESGIATPESWSEVGSQDGEESEVDPRKRRQLQASS